MLKTDALKLLGGTATSAAKLIGISVSAVSQWPDELPSAISDRVLAALARQHLPPELLTPEEGK
jgi:DNA-binding transcriptional regulator YdaS (Cro superfamily)